MVELDDETSNQLFEVLSDWEDQLRDVDFSVLDEEAPPEEESPVPKPGKHGGPTPC